MINKIALITGGSRGLRPQYGRPSRSARGRSSLHLSRKSDRSRVSRSRDRSRGAESGGISPRRWRDRVVDAFVSEVRKTLQRSGSDRFDYLVNNAGNSLHADFEETTEAQFDEIFNVHVKGVYFFTQKLLPLMNDGGRIVNISSGFARVSLSGSSAYGAAKGAVEVLAVILAKELGRRGITANVVAPGAIQTDFSGGMVRDNPEVNKRVAEMTALGRAGVPDDIASMIAALLSVENRWVNGQRIEVSGGMAL